MAKSRFSFLVIIARFGLLAGIWWSVFISKSQRILWISFFRMDPSLYMYHFVVWSNFSVLHNSQWITFPTQLCLVLNSFFASLFHYDYYNLIFSLSVFYNPSLGLYSRPWVSEESDNKYFWIFVSSFGWYLSFTVILCA